MKKEFLYKPEPEVKPKAFKPTKLYIRAERFGEKQVAENEQTEELYHLTINGIKERYAQLQNEEDKTVFEIDRKPDTSDIRGMHEFVTPSLRWSLYCDIEGKCWIGYYFFNCPFEDEINCLIKRHRLISRVMPYQIENYKIFHETTMAVQYPKYIAVLMPEEL